MNFMVCKLYLKKFHAKILITILYQINQIQISRDEAAAAVAAAKLLQSCLTLCDPIDDSPPGSAAPGILQARILEWVAIRDEARAFKILKTIL